MNIYTHHKEIRIVLTAIGKMFDGVILKRTNSNAHQDTIDQIAVPVLYSPKTRVIHDLVNLSKHIKLPIFCYQMKGIAFDDQRVFNKLDGFYAPDYIGTRGQKYPQPIPVKLTINTSFLARFQDDCDQYITNVFTNFQKYATFSYRHPDVNMEIRCKVIWDGNLNLNYPDELDPNKAYRTEIDTTFTVEAWLFKNTNDKDAVIYDVPMSFTALSELSENYFVMHEQEDSPYNTDYLTVSGRPWVRDVNRYRMFKDDDQRDFIVDGAMFDTVTGVALVDKTGEIFPADSYREYDCYSHDHTLAPRVPAFTGVAADFKINGERKLTFTMPKTLKGGFCDVVLLGKYGAGNLMKDSYREYMGENDQKPITVSGIQIAE